MGGLGSTPGGAGVGGVGGGPGRPDASSAAGGRGGGGGGGGMGGSMNNSNECLVYVNTLEACSNFAVRLRDMLERDASAAFGGGGGAGHDAERVMSCLQGLGSTRALFSRAASDCLEEVGACSRFDFDFVVEWGLGGGSLPTCLVVGEERGGNSLA